MAVMLRGRWESPVSLSETSRNKALAVRSGSAFDAHFCPGRGDAHALVDRALRLHVGRAVAGFVLAISTTVLARQESTLPERAILASTIAELEKEVEELSTRLASETSTCNAIQDQLNSCLSK